MSDLAKLSNAAVMEDYARQVRYADRLRGSSYTDRLSGLADELRRRGISPEQVAEAPAPPPVCRLQPLADHLVVRPEWEDDISKGGIIIVETAKAKPMQGEILAVGPGRYEPNVGTLPPVVKVGDVVLFGRYAGVEVVLDEQRVLILREEDLLGVLPPKDSE